MFKRMFTGFPLLLGFAVGPAFPPSDSLAADTDVTLNEVMYHAPQDLDELQYVELFNRGGTAVELTKWSFTKGAKFEFPPNSRIDPGGYLVVCRNLGVFARYYGSNVVPVGAFTGKLGRGGEKIELSNAAGRVVDSMKYSDRDPWPAGADGYSPSLERISPAGPGDDAANWSASSWSSTGRPAGTPGRKNDSFAEVMPPTVAKVSFGKPAPATPTTISAEVADAAGVREVTLLWQKVGTGAAAETEVPMRRVSGGDQRGGYQAAIPGQPFGSILRFRVRAASASGAIRIAPEPNEPRPTFTYSTFTNTNSARIALVHVLSGSAQRQPVARRAMSGRQSPPRPASSMLGNATFVYLPPDGGEVRTFDHVRYRPRKGGFKIKFVKRERFQEMTGLNVLFEGPARWVLSEYLAYDVYRQAGVPAPLSEHARVWLNGQALGYQLLVEQPNNGFLSRNQRDNTGNLYKANWFGQGLLGQHEKKTYLARGSADLASLHSTLIRKSGAEQWKYIQQNFHVGEFINYYAVNMCIQNWDGFFNNHYLYHDIAGTGKWEIYPWDEDKTWGDFDGAPPEYDWYEMPLTFGMNGDQPPRAGLLSRNTGWGGGPFGGGVSWWRPAGWFSGPLLANPEFRELFLARLGVLCNTLFTEENLLPRIDALEKRLVPEVSIRARLTGEDPAYALAELRANIQSYRNQVKHRREYILQHLPRNKTAR
jgi:hypothetical protein